MFNRTLAAVVAVISACDIGLHAGQDPATPAPLSFEAASVKPNRSGDPGTSIRRQPGGRLNAVNMPLRSLVTFAYQIQGFQLVNMPDAAGDERFDIVAKVEGDPAPVLPGSGPDPMMLAMRTLLADRFKLAIHRETRELDVYALVMARPGGTPGPSLRQSSQSTLDYCTRAMDAARRGGPPPVAPGGAPLSICGVRQTFGRIQFGGFPLSQFANGLAGQVGRVVVDRTGLTGMWDFELTFAAEPPRGPLPPGVELPPIDPDAPSLFTAIQEQLGLKLESTKGPVEVLVIDKVDRPTPD
jgi:uncharacterized protein (TIGR03435 family)